MDRMKQLRFQFNHRAYSKRRVYLTLGIGIGTSTRYFLRDEEEIHNNLAFGNVWANYLRLDSSIPFIFEVERNCTFVRCETNADSYGENLILLLSTIFNRHLDEDRFEKAKEITRIHFEQVYKQGAFRGFMKGYEYADSNRGFQMHRLLDDILNIRFDEFCELWKNLIVPSNCFVSVNGNLALDLTDDQMERIKQSIPDEDAPLKDFGEDFDPYLRHDSHLFEISRDRHFIDIIHLDFDERVEMDSRYIYTMVERMKIDCDNIMVNVDQYDASLIFEYPEVMSHKRAYKNLSTEKMFGKAKKKILSGWAGMLKNKPEEFGREVVRLSMNDINYINVLETLSNMNYDEYCAGANSIRPIVSEAQILMES